jgi:hypothetical protein
VAVTHLMKIVDNLLPILTNVWLRKLMRLILHDVGDGYYL